MSKVTNFLVVLSAFVGGIMASDAYRNRQIVKNLPQLDDVLVHLERMDENITKLAVTRCMSISTPNLNIYQVPNLGVVKVAPKNGGN